MPLATLSIDLEARLAKLQEGFDRAARLAEKDAARVEAAWEKAGAALRAAGTALAGVISANFIGNLVRGEAELASALERMAKLSGTTTDQFQRLTIAARTLGVGQEQVADVLKDVQEKIGEFLATGGGPLVDFFELVAPKVGVTAEQFRRLGGAEALGLFVQTLERANVSQKEAVFYLEGLASGSTALLPLLRDNGARLRELGDQAERFGVVMDDKAIAAAKRFNETLRELELRIEGLARGFAGPLLRTLNEFARISDNAERAGYGSVFEAALDVGTTELGRIDDLNRRLTDTARKLRELNDIAAQARAGGRAAPAEVLSQIADLERRERFLRMLQRDQGDLGRGPAVMFDAAPSAAPAGAPPGRTRGRTDRAAIERPLGAIRSAAEQYRADFLATERAAYGDIDAFLREAESRAQQLGTAILDPIAERRSAFLVAEKEGYEATERALRDAAEQIQRTQGLADDLGLTFVSAFEDAIVGGNGLRDVLRGLEADLVRIVTRRLVTEPLGNAASEFLGSVLKSGGGSIGDAITGTLGRLFAGGFAEGGFIPPGRWGIVGERGPEPAFGGRTGMTVQPAGGMTVVNHFHLAGPADQRTQAQIAAQAARAVERAALRNN